MLGPRGHAVGRRRCWPRSSGSSTGTVCVSPAKLIMDDDDDQSVDMDELASGWRPSWGGRRSAEGRSTVA